MNDVVVSAGVYPLGTPRFRLRGCLPMKDLQAKPCSLAQKIIVTLCFVGVLAIMGPYVLTRLYEGVIAPLAYAYSSGAAFLSSGLTLWASVLLVLARFSLIDNACELLSFAGALCLPVSVLLMAVYALFLSKKKVGTWVLASAFLMLGGLALIQVLGGGVDSFVAIKRILLSIFSSLIPSGTVRVSINIVADIVALFILPQIRLAYAGMAVLSLILAVSSIFGLRPRWLTVTVVVLGGVTIGAWLLHTVSLSFIAVGVNGVMSALLGRFIQWSVVLNYLLELTVSVMSSTIIAALMACPWVAALTLSLAHSPVSVFARKKA